MRSRAALAMPDDGAGGEAWTRLLYRLLALFGGAPGHARKLGRHRHDNPAYIRFIVPGFNRGKHERSDRHLRIFNFNGSFEQGRDTLTNE